MKNKHNIWSESIAFVLFLLLGFSQLASKSKVIVDSDMTFEESIKNTDAPKKIIDELVIIDVEYYSFDGKLHRGQLVINKVLKKDLVEIFDIIKKEKFPIARAIPIVEYDWSDNASMADNNTSAFCYRTIAGTKRLSNHAFGRAIDINPFNNPAVYKSGRIAPKGAQYDPNIPGTLKANGAIVKAFKERGWRWGGDFKSLKDYQHFDKR